jgi:uncharacterized membrane protein
MGAGMALLAAARIQAGWSNGHITRYVAMRGLVLILLGQVLENGSFMFGYMNVTRLETYGARVPGADGTLPVLLLGVLYGLGSSLIIGSVLIRLRSGALVGTAVVIALVTEWMMPAPVQVDVRFHPVLRLLFIPGQTDACWPSTPRSPGSRARSPAWHSVNACSEIARPRSVSSRFLAHGCSCCSSCFARPAALAM